MGTEGEKLEEKPVTAVRGLDLERYMGRWYEIACFPSAFQPRDGRGTRATYALRPDGTIRVLNETWTAGGVRNASIEGTAFLADPDSDEAKLKVRFYVPPFLPLFPVVGDYWVLFIDDSYRYAVIGQPSRKHLSSKPFSSREWLQRLPLVAIRATPPSSTQ